MLTGWSIETMIFISSACSQKKRIDQAVLELAQHGFTCIELTGGTEYYPDYQQDLLDLQKQFNLNYLLHNYFPPPVDHFVINLASLDTTTFKQSLSQLKKSIELSTRFSASKFGFHAGFTVDIGANELGAAIGDKRVWSKEKGIERFCEGFLALKKYYNQAGKLYLENNVYSLSNYKKFGDTAPLLLLTFEDYTALREKIDFAMLLDVAHLYVTCRTLKLSFEKELAGFMTVTDYIHVSENDGMQDQNLGIEKRSFLFKQLAKYDLSQKTVTLEIYSGIETVKQSYELIDSLMQKER